MPPIKPKIKPINLVCVMLAGICLLLTILVVVVVMKSNLIATSKSPVDVSSARSSLGINCIDGKAWNTTYSGSGFEQTTAVVLDSQTVDCAMVYKVGTQNLTLEQLYVKITNANSER